MNRYQDCPISANQLQMDRSSPLPPKRPRRTEQLHSKFVAPNNSSPTSSKMESNVHKQLVKLDRDVMQIRELTNIKPNLQSLSTLKFVPNKEINISSKMQTLKLKSPDGRDLGEINVKLLPLKGNKISGKTIMLKKHSMFGRLDTSSVVSILEPSKTQNLPIADVQPPARSSVDAAIASRLISSTTDHRTKSLMFKNNSIGYATNNSSPTSMSFKNIDMEETRDDRKKILSMIVVNDSARTNPSMRKIVISRERTKMSHMELSKCETVSKRKVVFVRGNNQSTSNSIEDSDDHVKDQPQLSMRKKFVLISSEKYEQLKQNCSPKNPKLNRSQQALSTDQAADSTNVMSVRSSDAILPRILSIRNQEKKAIEKSPPKSIGLDQIKQRIINGTRRTNITKGNITSGNIVARKNAIAPISTYESENENDTTSSSTDNDTESSLSLTETSFKEYANDFQSKKSNLHPPVPVKISSSEQRTVREITDTRNTDKHLEQANQHKDCELMKTKAIQPDKNITKTSNNDQNLHLGKNIMVKIHSEMGSLNDNSQISCNESLPSDHAKVDTNKKSDITLKANTIQSNVSHTNQNTNHFQDTIRLKQKGDTICHSKTAIEQDIDNLQRTLSTLADENLREKVLKALADCGIGLQREVPVQKRVSVKDSQSQTMIFSLLDSGNLLEFDNDVQTLTRTPVIPFPNQTNQSIMNEQMNNCNMDSRHQQYLHREDNSILSFDSMFCDIAGDDLFPDELLNSTEVNKVKNILTEPSPTITQTIKQLKKDFEAANAVDDNGFFGIHRAVLSGDTREVRRQLNILRGLKRNINNVFTEDGCTSLELAVMENVSAPIVKLLLSVGGKPASTDKLHESALIIACRKSLAVLPELISHVTPTSLLDIVSAEGFAPLHYCAQLGNLKGVELLVAAGADVNLRDLRSGRTALFHALEGKYITIAAHLLNNGAKSNIPNFSGQSPTVLMDDQFINSL